MATSAPALPGKSAKRATWERYAASQGLDAAEIKELSIAQLAERFGVASASPESAADGAPATKAPVAPALPQGPAGTLRKIYAPNRRYSGISAGVKFTDGVGETNNPGSLSYFERAGYGIDSEPAFASSTEEPRPQPELVSAQPHSNDAAVMPNAGGPVSDAFLPPTNAGLADPHGPAVVSPGLHAVPPAPIRPGEVFVDDPARQEAEETKLAELVLVEGAQAGIAAEPGGLEAPIVNPPDDAGQPGPDGQPARSANKSDWVAWAVAKGMPEDEANALKKEVLVERFGGES